MPDHTCAEAIRTGRLGHVLKGWHGVDGIVHVVFPTPRGLSSAVRAWIDHLVVHVRRTIVFAEALR
jgi:DNA-binding transcriptional LysR family regulator